jgi:hypothetical protein
MSAAPRTKMTGCRSEQFPWVVGIASPPRQAKGTRLTECTRPGQMRTEEAVGSVGFPQPLPICSQANLPILCCDIFQHFHRGVVARDSANAAATSCARAAPASPEREYCHQSTCGSRPRRGFCPEVAPAQPDDSSRSFARNLH